MSKFLRVDFKIQPWGCARVGGIDMIASLSVKEVNSLGGGIKDVVAVSHVWGDAQYLVENVKDASHGIKISSPKKMERLLNIAKREGWENLWLDNICINQEDGDEKSREVMKMGFVYRETKATLVLLDSTHSETLALTMNTLLCFSGEDGLTLLDEVMRDGWEELLELCMTLADDKWYERLWTMQECALPSRIYMAPVDEDIAYDVSGFKKCNNIYTKLYQFATNLIHNLDAERLPRIRVFITFIRRWKFHANMRMYNALVCSSYAKCSVEKDRVYGVLGLINPNVNITPVYDNTSTKELVVTMMKASVNNLQEMDLLHMHGPKLKEMGKCMVPTWECFQRHMTSFNAEGIVHTGNCTYDENKGLMVSEPCVFEAKIIAVIEPELLSKGSAEWIHNYRALREKLRDDQMVELLRGLLVADDGEAIHQGGKESKARELLKVWAYVASLPPETIVTDELKKRFGWDAKQQNQSIRVWSRIRYKNERTYILSITKDNNCLGLCCKRPYISAFQSNVAVEDDLREKDSLLVVDYKGCFHNGERPQLSRLPLIVAKPTQEGVKFISTIVLDEGILHGAIASVIEGITIM
ncbi:hypothetical protein KC19_9G102700 [Ceratodon purpureus]|uniref:Heterokaryon incompatibility domain-containing protein n=1 Tax=Ceratodon purpureus TaxID=3225 RepID=A0A8T0GYD7_CERPU|nr:hypothetical protein KC19_9G102700 [Ceratodon purpureus]